jgi:hypothetical protein
MRYFLLISVFVIGCGEPSRPPAAQSEGGGPVNVTGMNGGTGGSTGVGGAGGAGGSGGFAMGACDNPSDLEALATTGSVRDVARDCALFRCADTIANGNSYQACVESCVENDVQELSSECAGSDGALQLGFVLPAPVPEQHMQRDVPVVSAHRRMHRGARSLPRHRRNRMPRVRTQLGRAGLGKTRR